MEDGTWVLILLVFVMLVGSYVAGSIPLNVSMSEDKLQKVTVFGAGLLVGTALAVIIPEGVRALFSEHSKPTTITKDFTASPSEHDDEDLHSVIGITLVLGFVFMLLVDQISSRYTEPGASEKNMTATIGLVVHAAADGIALGAAATTSHFNVEIIVFLAIMLHKAPAAFGLVTFLLHSGMERNRIRKHLLIFSISAPLLTMVTYFCIGDESQETLSNSNATGIAMLFSAGTFLYVATVHVVADLTHAAPAHVHVPLPLSEGGAKRSHGLQLPEVALLAVGALLPVLLTLGHHH